MFSSRVFYTEDMDLRYLLLMIPFLSGCLTNCPYPKCGKTWILTGVVSDSLGNPVSGVQVDFVSHYGDQEPITVTDANGEYHHIPGPSQRMGDAYLVFSKTGFQSSSSTALNEYDATCGESTLVRNAVLSP
ncbi:carboxypeptidase-like regulatory domain-containing protein [Bdellovibrio sp. HCB274]|uniref:carboxypeptidase-like regulatory domain-containing protein n=1 Tax=Bdellovibrio sp. HCB274 TaxID=3394361 RepID=UPI0039B57ECE